MGYSSRSLLGLVALTLAISSRDAGGQSATAATFRRILSALYTGAARADTAALEPLLAQDLVWVLGANGTALTKPQLLRAAAAHPPGAPARFDVDSVRVRTVGDAAFVDLVRTDRWTVGATSAVYRSRVLDVFVRERGRWRLARHTQTWLVDPVSPARDVARDLAALYRARRDGIASGLSPLPVQYADYTLWQQTALGDEADAESALARLRAGLRERASRPRPAAALTCLVGARPVQVLPTETAQETTQRRRPRSGLRQGLS